jgi:hypothetical protein
MKNQSINSINELLEYLTQDSNSYYIKQKSISSFEDKKGRILYSHFKPHKGKITPTLLQQHLNKEITLAIDLEKDNRLLYEYRGKRAYAFGVLFFKLIDKDLIEYSTILKYDDEMIVIFLEFKSCDFIENFKEEMEKSLVLHLEKEWRVYPVKNRPKIGNLIELPREYIQLPWSF